VTNRTAGFPINHVPQVAAFVYALFPFFFLHFMLIFVRHYEILRSKKIIVLNYFAGMFGYALILLGWIPLPINSEIGVGPVGSIYFLTWMSILFSVGVALLYSSVGGFNERGINSSFLLVAFAFLTLLLPSPFTLSIFAHAGQNNFILHFI
jgi:hypothetical protein